MDNKSHRITLAVVLMVMALVITACAASAQIAPATPSEGEAGQAQPAPEEPVEAPPEPEPTKEPAAPEVPAEPAPTKAPAESEGDVTSQGDLLKILIVLVIILLIIGVIMMIVAALGGGGKSQATAEAPPTPQSVEDHLNTATPKAAELYKRFAELVQTYGQIEIVPTQSRIDFRVRTIFASVEFREDSLLVLLVLLERLESPRVIRVDTYTQTNFANYLYIRTLDEYDAEFSAWLQEAYNLGVRGM